MQHDREFTPAEIAHMKLAGIPADRPGLLGEYPLMVYRKGEGSASLYGEPFSIMGNANLESMVVNNPDEELAAKEYGWDRSLSLVEAKRGPGRPPKVDAA